MRQHGATHKSSGEIHKAKADKLHPRHDDTINPIRVVKGIE